MCVDPGTLSIISTGIQVGGTLLNAQGQSSAGAASSGYYNYLAHITDKQGDLASESASRDSAKLNNSVRDTLASQKTAFAANGIALSSPTVTDVTVDTLNKASMDEAVIRYNADIANYNARTQAAGYRSAAANAVSAANTNAFTTLLGGASSVASAWSGLKVKTA